MPLSSAIRRNNCAGKRYDSRLSVTPFTGAAPVKNRASRLC
jgi:hypothetical protein